MRDHLGNTRVTFADLDGNGLIDPGTELLQEDNYYPFGMRHGSPDALTASPPNKYLYNGKELQDELGLNWVDYGARMLDPSIGRWNGVDALADSFLSVSPYSYTLCNPIIFKDPNGKDVYLIINGEAVNAKQIIETPSAYGKVGELFQALSYMQNNGFVGAYLNNDDHDVYIATTGYWRSITLPNTHELNDPNEKEAFKTTDRALRFGTYVKKYGLTREELSLILKNFEKVDISNSNSSFSFIQLSTKFFGSDEETLSQVPYEAFEGSAIAYRLYLLNGCGSILM